MRAALFAVVHSMNIDAQDLFASYHPVRLLAMYRTGGTMRQLGE